MRNPKMKNPRIKDPRIENPMIEDPRIKDPRIEDPGIKDPVHGLKFSPRRGPKNEKFRLLAVLGPEKALGVVIIKTL